MTLFGPQRPRHFVFVLPSSGPRRETCFTVLRAVPTANGLTTGTVLFNKGVQLLQTAHAGGGLAETDGTRYCDHNSQTPMRTLARMTRRKKGTVTLTRDLQHQSFCLPF